MKHKIMNIILFIILAISRCLSQIDCPPTGEGDWISGLAVTDCFLGGSGYGPGGSVQFYYRQISSNPNIFQVKMDWSTLVNSSDFITNSVLKKLLEVAAVMSIIPRTPYNETYIYVYFVKECKATVKAVIELEKDAEVVCSDPGVTYCQEWYSKLQNGINHSFYNIYQIVVCGYKCCARRYKCTVLYDNLKYTYVPSIQEVTTITISDCPSNSSFRDCLPPNDYLPCEGSACDEDDK